jgi:solute carrier family 25 (mitochondrial phosphate transporter), member 23/24/25/41
MSAQLTDGQKDEAIRLFRHWDSNKDGTLSLEEVQAGLAALQVPPSLEEAETVFHLFDKNNDGKVTIDEFLSYIETREADIQQTFDALDSDHNGFLDESELKSALQNLDLDYEDTAVQSLMNKIDKNKNGLIEYFEFRQLLVLLPTATLQSVFEHWQTAAILTTDDLNLPPITTAPNVNANLVNFVAGATASILSKTSTAPLERVKVLYQMQTSKPPSMFTTLKSLYQEAGIVGLFRGNLVNLMKSSPENAVKFMVFEACKDILYVAGIEEPPHAYIFACASMGGVAAHSLCFPLEVLKTKLAGSSKEAYRGLIDCIGKVYAADGIRGFYRGVGPAVLSTIPHSGVTLTSYTAAKDFFARRSPTGHASSTGLMIAAAVSTICGQVVSQPLHVIKVRLIMGPNTHLHGGSHGAHATAAATRDYGHGAINVIKNTWKFEGPSGFFRGFTPAIVKGLPSHCISLGVYEYFRRVWGVEKKKKHH